MKLLLIFFVGVITWPVLEYSLHRFLGHVLKLNTLFKKEHTRHHAETNYFAPKSFKIMAAIPVCVVGVIAANLILSSLDQAIIFISGFVFMYSLYEWFHWSIHAKAPKTKLGLKLRKHHLAHHFHNPKLNHGVTTTFIDKLLGTFHPVSVVKIPKHVPLPWLVNAENGTINQNFRDHFQVK